MALFASRSIEPTGLAPYREYLESNRVTRIYLDEIALLDGAPLGLSLIRLLFVDPADAPSVVEQIKQRAQASADERSRVVLDLMEEALIRRFDTLSREEIRKMFGLEDIRKTRVWQEAKEEGMEEGKREGMEEGKREGMEEGKQHTLEEVVGVLISKGKTIQEVSDLLDISEEEVQRLRKR